MNELVLEINRNYIKKKINKNIDDLFNEIKNYNNLIKSKDKELKELNNKYVQMSRAYCKKMGVLISKKSNKQVCKETIKLLSKECEQSE